MVINPYDRKDDSGDDVERPDDVEMVDLYAKMARKKYAEKVMESIKNPDDVTRPE